MRDKEKNSESKEKWTETRIERGSPLLLTLVQHRISMEQRRKREEGKEEKIEEKGRQHGVRPNEEQARKMKESRGGRRGRQGKDLRRRRKKRGDNYGTRGRQRTGGLAAFPPQQTAPTLFCQMITVIIFVLPTEKNGHC